MDTATALAILSTLAADNAGTDLIASLPFDAREDIVLYDGTTVILGTVGTVNVWARTDGTETWGIDAHEHNDDADAAQCHERNVGIAHQHSADNPLAEALRRLIGAEGSIIV
jgi:hypothetical protein